MPVRKRLHAALAVIVGAVVWLPRVAVPLGSAGCICKERGGAVTLDEATVARQPAIELGGEACGPADFVCLHRDRRDRCDVLWIEPTRAGTCVVGARFSDGTRIDRTIEFVEDTEYPCRGNVRPQSDAVTRLDAKG